MKSYQKIVVAINYTESSRNALKQARQIAAQSGASIRAFHAVPPVTLNEFLSFYLIPHDIMMTTALSGLETFVEETLGPDHGVPCFVAEGKPHQAVVAFVQESQADLLILGTDEYTNKPHNSGQFAIKCLRHTAIPVLLVRNHLESPFTRLTACVDFSKSTTQILEHTARFTVDTDQVVEIAHASCPPWLHPPYLRYQTEVFENRDVKEQYHELIDGQMGSIQKLATDLLKKTPLTIKLEHEDTKIALIDHLEEAQSDLAILGHWGTGAHGLKTKLLGGTSEALIRYAHCSILIVPVTP